MITDLTLPERSVTPASTIHHPPSTVSAQRFTFRTYQREDLARAALHDGAIIAWDPGLGKTMAIFAWPFLKHARRTLIVAPAALHAQIIKEGRDKFGVTVTPVKDQDAALALMHRGILPFPGTVNDVTPANAANPAMPDFFITDYRWLGYNGADEMLEPNSVQHEARRPVVARHLGVHPSALPDFLFRETPIEEYEQIVKRLDPAARALVEKARSFLSGTGIVRRYLLDDGAEHAVTCCFAPSLATILADAFDCVVCDEAVRLKSGTESYIARGVLTLNPRYRLALTGTPIKNRLPDIFFLATWVCGSVPGGSARFPYGCTVSHQNAFASNHLVMEENLTKTERSRRDGCFRRFVKQVNKLTNVHRLWKLLGPVVIRRRKDDIGEDIVPKRIVPVKVMPGEEQHATYQWHMDNPPDCETKTAALGAQLQYLRQAALCPWTSCLPHVRSASHWSPKMAAILHLATDLVEKGEQLVVFSPFQDFSTALQARFREAGVDSLLLDGRVNNVQRGERVAAFKSRRHPVLIAGIASMGEGHSLECASHLVLPSLSWAYDENAQAIERVHRLTSRQDVTIYALVTRGTIDERLAQLFDEKGDASDLALDGRLFEDDREEISLAELLHSARMDFKADAETLSESEVQREWESILKPRLALAAAAFKNKVGSDALGRPEGSPESRPTPAPAVTTETPNPSNLLEFPGLFSPTAVRNPLPKTPRPAPSSTKEAVFARIAAAFA